MRKWFGALTGFSLAHACRYGMGRITGCGMATFLLVVLQYFIAMPASGACYWDSFSFGVDSWVTAAPQESVLATFNWHGSDFPALVAVDYVNGRAVFTAGSTFSELANITDPANVRHQIFLNSTKWVTKNKQPSQTKVLVTYGHRELVTYWNGSGCCSSNAVQALTDAGYDVSVSLEVPSSLAGYDAVIMPGVGWGGTPGYSNPLYWSDAGHAPTNEEIDTLLYFIQNGGGLVTSLEAPNGASWMTPIANPMGMTVSFISFDSPLVGHRIVEHPIFLKACPDTQPPVTTAMVSGTLGNNGWYISDVLVTLTATDNGGSGVKEIHYTIDGTETVVTGSSASFTISTDETHNITYYAKDNADNSETPHPLTMNIDKTPPVVNISTNPGILWPPNHKMVDVVVNGSASDSGSGIASVVITATDEYGVYNMTVPGFGSAIQLEASRDGTDKDGRVYTITAVATDKAGNRSTAATAVLVPHDMR